MLATDVTVVWSGLHQPAAGDGEVDLDLTVYVLSIQPYHSQREISQPYSTRIQQLNPYVPTAAATTVYIPTDSTELSSHHIPLPLHIQTTEEHNNQEQALQETDKCSWVKVRTWVPMFLLELSSWVILKTWVLTFLI
jgi:hypothetical protein